MHLRIAFILASIELVASFHAFSPLIKTTLEVTRLQSTFSARSLSNLCGTSKCTRLLNPDTKLSATPIAVQDPPTTSNPDPLSVLAKLYDDANRTALAGWQLSQDDPVNGRDRDGTWVTRNDGLMDQLKRTLNDTLVRNRTWRWLAASPKPLFIKAVKTPGVEITFYFIPTGQSMPPLEYPTGAVILSKALFGTCEVKQMLGNPRGKGPMREAVRSLITQDSVSLYLGGPCRVYGEATMERGCAVVEVALLPKMRITGMNGFVEQAPGEERPDWGGGEVMQVALRWERAEELVCSAAWAEREALVALEAPLGEGHESEESEAEEEPQDELDELSLERLRRQVGGLDEELARLVRRTLATRRLPPGMMEQLGLRHVKGVLLYG